MPTLGTKAVRVISSTLRSADHPPDGERALRNAARATTILGRLLDDMANTYAKQLSPAARLIMSAGLLTYGLVEISVPRSIWHHIGRYSIQVLTLIGSAMVGLGLVLQGTDTWKIGLLVLLVAWLISWIRDLFSWIMRSRRGFPLSWSTQVPLLALVISISALAIRYAQTVNDDLVGLGRGLIKVQSKMPYPFH